MDINIFVGGMMLAALGYFMTYAFFHGDKPPPSSLPWVPIDVRRTKVYVSQTRDAGMFVERQRRTAIIGNKDGNVGATGYLDAFLTGICVCPALGPVCPPEPTPVVWSNGDANDEICDNVDAGGAFGGYDVVDFGGVTANVCDV